MSRGYWSPMTETEKKLADAKEEIKQLKRQLVEKDKSISQLQDAMMHWAKHLDDDFFKRLNQSKIEEEKKNNNNARVMPRTT